LAAAARRCWSRRRSCPSPGGSYTPQKVAYRPQTGHERRRRFTRRLVVGKMLFCLFELLRGRCVVSAAGLAIVGETGSAVTALCVVSIAAPHVSTGMPAVRCSWSFSTSRRIWSTDAPATRAAISASTSCSGETGCPFADLDRLREQPLGHLVHTAAERCRQCGLRCHQFGEFASRASCQSPGCPSTSGMCAMLNSRKVRNDLFLTGWLDRKHLQRPTRAPYRPSLCQLNASRQTRVHRLFFAAEYAFTSASRWVWAEISSTLDLKKRLSRLALGERRCCTSYCSPALAVQLAFDLDSQHAQFIVAHFLGPPSAWRPLARAHGALQGARPVRTSDAGHPVCRANPPTTPCACTVLSTYLLICSVRSRRTQKCRPQRRHTFAGDLLRRHLLPESVTVPA